MASDLNIIPFNLRKEKNHWTIFYIEFQPFMSTVGGFFPNPIEKYANNHQIGNHETPTAWLGGNKFPPNNLAKLPAFF